MINYLQPSLFDPNAQYLFDRSYAFSIGAPGQTTAFQYGTSTVPTPSPIRLRFDIDKNMFGASANHSKIELYNIATEKAQSIRRGYIVQLQAGYKKVFDIIFTGNVFITKRERNGADIITSLECLDGGSAISFGVLDKSYGPGTTLVQILTDVAKAMSATTVANPQGVNAGIAVGIPDLVYNKNFVAHGSCKDTLDKLLKPLGLEWNVQNGNLNIIPKTAFDGNTAQLVSLQTGMIGVPSDMQDYMQFTSLLNPRLIPGALVQMESENVGLNGFYKIRRSKFEGDSHDNKWQVTCECIPMPNSIQALHAVSGFNYASGVGD